MHKNLFSDISKKFDFEFLLWITVLFSKLAHLFKHTLSYGSYRIFASVISFILLPVYTRFLSPAEYGIIETAVVFAAILTPFYSMGQGAAVVRIYFDYDEEEKKKELMGSLFLFFALTLISLSLLQTIFGSAIYNPIFKEVSFFPFLCIMVWASCSRSLASMGLSLFRAREESLKFALLQSISLFVTIYFSIYFVVLKNQGAVGKLKGHLYGSVLLLLMVLIFLVKHMKPAFNMTIIRNSLALGLPLVPHMLAGWIINLSDRLILQYYSDISEVGLYSVGVKIASVLQMIVLSFNSAWSPFMFSLLKKEENAKEQIAKLSTIYAAAVLFLAVALSIFSKEVIFLMTEKSFHHSYTVVPLIAYSYVFYGMYLMLTNQFFYAKKTLFLPFITGSVAVINIILNFLFIPQYGMIGASTATLLSFIFYGFVTYFYSTKVIPINYEVKRIFILFVSSICCLVPGLLLNFGLYTNLAIKLLILVLYPVLIYFGGFFRKEEITTIKALISRKIKK